MTNYERELLSLQSRLLNYAGYLTRDEDSAKDLLQETMLRVFLNEEKYRTDYNLLSWVVTIMRNSYLNELRSSSRRSRTLIGGYDDIDEPVSAVCDGECEYSCSEIMILVHALPPEQARLLLRRIEGYKYEEIATELSLPLGTVKSGLHMARTTLKRLMEG